MAQHGGKRTPSNPAPVSGPGSLSRRTDGGPAQKLRPITGLAYGENKELNTQQASAPLAQTPTPGAGAPPSAPAVNPASLGSFDAPTARPDEPVTAGAAAGPGPGPEALGLPDASTASYQSALQTLQSVGQASGSTEVAALLDRMQSGN